MSSSSGADYFQFESSGGDFQVDVMEPVTDPGFAGQVRDGGLEHRAGVAEGVEFSALAAGIDGWWKLMQQGRVEFASQESGIQLAGVDACDCGSQSSSNHCSCELRRGGVVAPEREEGSDFGAGELLLAVGADIR